MLEGLYSRRNIISDLKSHSQFLFVDEIMSGGGMPPAKINGYQCKEKKCLCWTLTVNYSPFDIYQSVIKA